MPAPLHGQVAVTGSAQPLSTTQVACTVFTIKASPANTSLVYIGGSGVTTANGYPLDAGEEVTYERSDQVGQTALQLGPADFFVVGSSGMVGWLASP